MHLASELIVDAAKSEDIHRIENLMQFYNYDMSQWLAVTLGDNGLTLSPINTMVSSYFR